MKHCKPICSVLGAILFLIILTASPAFAAPNTLCVLNPTPFAIHHALDNPSCLVIKLSPGIYREYGLNTYRDIVIQGSGADTTIIDGMGQNRIFRFNGFMASISDITLRNGKARNRGMGGAIFSDADLHVQGVHFENNSALNGGAIAGNSGLYTILDSTFTANFAESDGGALVFGIDVFWQGQHAIVNGCRFVRNTAGNYGGAIGSSINLDVTNSSFVKNQTPGTFPGEGFGGAINVDRGNATIQNNMFEGNQARVSGGAISIFSGQTTSILHSAFRQNKAERSGGAVYEQEAGAVVLSFDTIERNVAPVGGGIAAVRGEQLLVSYSTFARNRSARVNLDFKNAASVPLKLNPAKTSAHKTPQVSGFAGGGIYMSVPSVLLNSTFSGNTSKGNGGGIYADTLVALSFITFADNKASAAGGSIYAAQTAPAWVQIKNTILQGRTPQNCFGADSNSFHSYGGNLSNDHSCESWLTQSKDKNGINARLAPLANNGGKSLTRALLPASPAIHGAINCRDISGNLVSDDQRQFARSARCDVGAFQIQ